MDEMTTTVEAAKDYTQYGDPSAAVSSTDFVSSLGTAFGQVQDVVSEFASDPQAGLQKLVSVAADNPAATAATAMGLVLGGTRGALIAGVGAAGLKFAMDNIPALQPLKEMLPQIPGLSEMEAAANQYRQEHESPTFNEDAVKDGLYSTEDEVQQMVDLVEHQTIDKSEQRESQGFDELEFLA